jgi:hypothetical protein
MGAFVRAGGQSKAVDVKITRATFGVEAGYGKLLPLEGAGAPIIDQWEITAHVVPVRAVDAVGAAADAGREIKVRAQPQHLARDRDGWALNLRHRALPCRVGNLQRKGPCAPRSALDGQLGTDLAKGSKTATVALAHAADIELDHAAPARPLPFLRQCVARGPYVRRSCCVNAQKAGTLQTSTMAHNRLLPNMLHPNDISQP